MRRHGAVVVDGVEDGFESLAGVGPHFQAGSFLLNRNMSMLQIANELQNGRADQKVVTIPEGYPLKFAAQLFVDMNDVLGQFRALIPQARALAAAGRAEEALATLDAALAMTGLHKDAGVMGLVPRRLVPDRKGQTNAGGLSF